ncbi:MAG: tetratricopeptide repeat protein [Planctomycetes bacterium]|nr:tetratricopeptide repeat protein [Planctomycetota bacterium]
MPTPAEILQQAMGLHRAGRLPEAEKAYATVPMDAPEFVDALHLTGVIALQKGDAQGAINLITRAVQTRPDVPAMHSNLAEAYRSAGKLNDAVAHCRAALNLDAGYHACRVNLALALASQGNLPDAEKELRRVLDAQPANALAWNNLGNVLRVLKRVDEALAAARKACQLEPTNAEFLSNLGQMLLEDGDTEEALQRLANAVKLNPRLSAARNNYGNALREAGRLDEAEAQYNEALKQNPQLAITHNNIGQLNQERGNYAEAMRWYEQSLKLDPRAAKTVCNYASVLAELDRILEAERLYVQAAKMDPGCAEAHIGLGAVAQRRGDTAPALAHYDRAEQANPRLPALYVGRSGVLNHLGRFDDAEKNLRRALQLDPGCPGAWESLAGLLKAKMPAADLAGLRAALQAPTSKRSNGMQSLHFAMGVYADATKDYATAAPQLALANELQEQSWQRRGLAYSADEHTMYVNEMVRVFDAAHFKRTAGWGNASEVPVFILGLPRSGTTLVEQVLASHPRVFGADELRLARDSFESLPAVTGAASRWEAVAALNRDHVQAVADAHLKRLLAYAPTADRISDKMPENYLHIGMILTLFQNAKIIHLRRDLRDVATSCWNTHFGQIRWANTQANIASHFANYWRVMQHWRNVLPGRFHEVRYEDMVDDLEPHARKLLEFVNVEWDDRCLQFHKTERTVRTASVTQVREPLYKRSVERWRNYEPWHGEWFTRLDAIQNA